MIAASVTPRPKEWVCGRSFAGIMGSNPAGCMDICRECCVLSRRGLRQADNSSRGVLPIVVCQWDREASTMCKPWPTRADAPW